MGPGHEPFEVFGPAHLCVLFLTVAVGAALPLGVRRWSGLSVTYVARTLAVVLVGSQLLKHYVRVVVFGDRLVDNLPFQMCDLAVYVGGLMLLRLNWSYAAYEVLYFWAFAGTSMALLTPDVPGGFGHPFTALYFLTHGLIIVALLYATLGFGWRPRWRSVLRAFLVTNAYALLVTPLNLVLDANYVYLRGKPEQPTLLDYLGPWPWYILACEVLAFVLFVLCYSPFAVVDLRKAQPSPPT